METVSQNTAGMGREEAVRQRIRLTATIGPADPVAGEIVDNLGVEGLIDVLEGRLPLPEQTPETLQEKVENWCKRWQSADIMEVEAQLLRAAEAQVIIPSDPQWPAGLHGLGGLEPWCLWVRGNAEALRQPLRRTVSIVGSRNASPYSQRVASTLATGLAEAGVSIVSGGAFGVDVAAHEGSLVAGGATIAVMAGGIDVDYPRQNIPVFREICKSGGALIAEVPCGVRPMRHRFLERNRLIAALAEVTVVIQAAHRSGALSTAAAARELGRQLGAVPGPIVNSDYAGSNLLLREGAVCITEVQDVLELLEPISANAPEQLTLGPAYAPADLAFLDVFPTGRWLTLEQVVSRSGRPRQEVLNKLNNLEQGGLIRRRENRFFQVV